MSDYESKHYDVFEMFAKQWALVAAGNPVKHNACTVAWGSLGTIWTRSGSSGSIVTVYLHPARFTRDVLLDNSHFTVSFYPPEYKKALGYMGSHSGRKEIDKDIAAGLTPVAFGESITYKESNLTFLCRKLYQHQFAKEDLHEDIQNYYKQNPKSFPVDEHGDWQPHWMFVGEILDVLDKR